jgi:hypothetical protein
LLALALVYLAGCGDSHVPMGDDFVAFGADGRSDELSFDVPAGARSVTILVEGDPAAMYALGSLRLADGVEHVEPIAVATLRERNGSFEGTGAEMQFPRPGTFVFQYPTLATQALPPGEATLRVVSDGSAPARVRIYAPTGSGTVLHVALVSFSPAFPLDVEPAVIEDVRAIYEPAGISIVVDERVSGPTRAPIVFGPLPPAPGDAGGELVRAAQALLDGDAFPIVFTEHADDAVLGSSRGVPCPPVPENDEHAIIIDATVDSLGADDRALMARIIAHELGHALGLPHLDGVNTDGTSWVDAFDDTEGLGDTIMGSALRGGPIPPASFRISPQQVFALTRSALLD